MRWDRFKKTLQKSQHSKSKKRRVAVYSYLGFLGIVQILELSKHFH